MVGLGETLKVIKNFSQSRTRFKIFNSKSDMLYKICFEI